MRRPDAFADGAMGEAHQTAPARPRGSRVRCTTRLVLHRPHARECSRIPRGATSFPRLNPRAIVACMARVCEGHSSRRSMSASPATRAFPERGRMAQRANSGLVSASAHAHVHERMWVWGRSRWRISTSDTSTLASAVRACLRPRSACPSAPAAVRALLRSVPRADVHQCFR